MTEFVRECRKIVNETAGQRGDGNAILGVVVPWDLEYCRVMGLDVQTWIKDGLLDYVSPTEWFVTEFRMTIQTWAKLAAGTRCGVYPGIIGATPNDCEMFIPEEYQFQRGRSITKITHENIRTLGHGFYAEGADGISFSNFHLTKYSHLLRITDACLPENIEEKEHRYVYFKEAPLWAGQRFLRLELPGDSRRRKTIPCRLHENLNKVDTLVRFKPTSILDLGTSGCCTWT